MMCFVYVTVLPFKISVRIGTERTMYVFYFLLSIQIVLKTLLATML